MLSDDHGLFVIRTLLEKHLQIVKLRFRGKRGYRNGNGGGSGFVAVNLHHVDIIYSYVEKVVNTHLHLFRSRNRVQNRTVILGSLNKSLGCLDRRDPDRGPHKTRRSGRLPPTCSPLERRAIGRIQRRDLAWASLSLSRSR